MVRPPTMCVSKVTVTNEKYTNILMGTVQYATAMGVLDSGPRWSHPQSQGRRCRDHCLGLAQPSVTTVKDLDHKVLFDIHRKATTLAIHKAMNFQPSIDWLLENQER